MLLCNPKHPEHYGYSGKGWGGCVGDSPSTSGLGFFAGTLHTKLIKHNKTGYYRVNVVLELDGKWITLFKDLNACCKVHMQEAITIKAAILSGRGVIPQTHPFPVLSPQKYRDKKVPLAEIPLLELDKYARAFITAKKTGRRQKDKFNGVI